MVDGNLNFMQGHSVKDSAGNIIRIIEDITGKTFADFILELGSGHEDYFYNYFPAVLDEYIELVKAIQFLHNRGEKHGDIRRDHILKEKQTGKCRWIDFDFNYLHKENMFGYDLYGLSNMLVYLDELKSSTVVVGRRGITRKEEFLFGSTSSKILREAKDCSIWVIQ
jgi:hypothetical protein